MPKVFTSKSQKKGELGEEIAKVFLVKHGFEIIERNYTKKWGELDIVAIKNEKLYFIEVKSVSGKDKGISHETHSKVSYETGKIQPQDNMHPKKMERLYRTIETYLMERNVPESMEWQLDLVCVYMDDLQKKALVKRVEKLTG